jgi:tetratricopeptide (TPR) repeat protein
LDRTRHPSASRTGRARPGGWRAAEYPALLAAIEQAAASGLAGHAWRLTWVLAIYLDRNGYWHEAVAAHRSTLAAVRQLADPTVELRMLRGLGFCYVRVGRYDDAQAHLTEALDRAAELDDRPGTIGVHRTLAWMYDLQHRLPEAIVHLEHAIDRCLAAGDRSGSGDALRSLGVCQSGLGQHGEAAATCRRAVAALQEVGYQRAVSLFADAGDRYNEAVGLTGLGDTQAAAGGDAAARRTWLLAAAILDDIGHPDADAVRARPAR